MQRTSAIGEGCGMAAPSLTFLAPPEALRPSPDFEAELALERLRAAATLARDRIAEIEGVRALGPEVTRDTSSVRLAIDLRDTGRDAFKVACSMADRGVKLDAASNRVIVVRLTAEDAADAIHHRLASALQLALWATPA